MHRSGTSAVTQAISSMGAHVRFPTGYWENLELTGLNQDILSSYGRSWDDPAGLPDGWEDNIPINQVAKDVFHDNLGKYPQWIWKDPRNCIMLPLWEKYIGDPIVVFIKRDPIEIAKSLQNRNGFSIQKGLDLCSIYDDHATRNTEDFVVKHIEYSDLVENTKTVLRDLYLFLKKADVENIHHAPFNGGIDASLRHHGVT